jgi:hypothetical protein
MIHMASKELSVDDYVVKRGSAGPVGIIFEKFGPLTVGVKWGVLDGFTKYEEMSVEELQIVFPEIDDEMPRGPIRHNVFDQDAQ